MGALSPTDSWWPRLDRQSAMAQTRGRGSYGRLNMTGFGGASKDTAWERRLVLDNATGAMVVVDTLTAAAFQGGYLSGVLWKFAAETNATVGEPLSSNAVDFVNFETTAHRLNKRHASHSVGQCATDHYDQCPLDEPSTKRLLCIFGGNAVEESYGLAPGWRSPSMRNATDLSPVINPRDFASRLFKTVYSKRRLQGARPNVFVSVFVPHDRASETAAMLAGTTITVTADQVKVAVALEEQESVEVSLGEGDTWTLAGS
jgi:hypothetical protein